LRHSAPRGGPAITAEAAWAQLGARPVSERPALMRTYLGAMAPHELTRLVALSEAAARREVLERLARRQSGPPE
jgi:hypothetical protein